MHSKIEGKTTFVAYDFDNAQDARAFYDLRVESVDDGTMLGVQFNCGEEQLRHGVVMTDRQPVSFRTRQCRVCHRWAAALTVWDGVCETCEAGAAAFDREYEQHEAFFNTRKKAELFHKSLKGTQAVIALKRPFEDVNQHGEDCWTVTYVTRRKKK